MDDCVPGLDGSFKGHKVEFLAHCFRLVSDMN